MAIPDNRLSTVPHLDTYIPPDGYDRISLDDKELGPANLGDISEGLTFQTWHLTYSDPDFTITPGTSGTPITTPTIPAVANVTQLSFAFDQNANITIAYTVGTTASLYWFDTVSAGYITTPSIADAISPFLCLDDKRITQRPASDVLLFYTKVVGPNWVLHMRRQRDRYADEYDMQLPCWPYIWKLGMHEGLRLQITTRDTPP